MTAPLKVFIGRFFDDIDYINKCIEERGGIIVDSWETADVIWKVSSRGFDETIRNKQIYIFPHQDMLTEKANLVHSLPILFPRNVINQIVPLSFIANRHNIDNVLLAIRKHYDEKRMLIIKPSNAFGGMNVNVLFLADIKKYTLKYPKVHSWIIQEYLIDPLLIKHKTQNFMCKFDLRVNFFMCTNRQTKQIEIYQFREILVRVSDKEYNTKSTNQETHVTNLDLRENALTDNSTRNFSETPELKSHYDAIQKYIMEYVLPLFKMVYYPAYNSQNNNYFQRFGIDLMINQDGSIKMLEMNSNPGQPNTRVPLNMAISYTMNNAPIDGVPEQFILHDDSQLHMLCGNPHNLKFANSVDKFILINDRALRETKNRKIYVDYLIAKNNNYDNYIAKNKIIIDDSEGHDNASLQLVQFVFYQSSGCDGLSIPFKNKLLHFAHDNGEIINNSAWYKKTKKLVILSEELKNITTANNRNSKEYNNYMDFYLLDVNINDNKIAKITRYNFTNAKINTAIFAEITK
jgi:hypothetical protein